LSKVCGGNYTSSFSMSDLLLAIARALNTKVYCDSRKAAILRCQQDAELESMLTKDPYAADVHLVPLSVITSDRITEYTERWKGHWDKAIGFRPTGWTCVIFFYLISPSINDCSQICASCGSGNASFCRKRYCPPTTSRIWSYAFKTDAQLDSYSSAVWRTVFGT
jgi:hypothetical protein